MSQILTLELPDEVYEAVKKAAEAKGKTPAEWVTESLRQRLPVRDERLRRHFGAIDLGHPTGADNESIDADLAREYSSSHEQEAS